MAFGRRRCRGETTENDIYNVTRERAFYYFLLLCKVVTKCPAQFVLKMPFKASWTHSTQWIKANFPTWTTYQISTLNGTEVIKCIKTLQELSKQKHFFRRLDFFPSSFKLSHHWPAVFHLSHDTDNNSKAFSHFLPLNCNHYKFFFFTGLWK